MLYAIFTLLRTYWFWVADECNTLYCLQIYEKSQYPQTNLKKNSTNAAKNNKRPGKESIFSEALGLSMPTMAAHLNEVPARYLLPLHPVIEIVPFL